MTSLVISAFLRSAGALVIAIMLLSCDGASPRDQANSPSPNEVAAAFELPAGMAELPGDLMDLVWCRREYVATFEIEPDLAFDGVNTDALRRCMVRNQPIIEAALDAVASLRGTLPDAIEFDETAVREGRHLAVPRAILLNNARVLRADAVRCWEANELTRCVLRFDASLGIAEYLLEHDDRASRFRGGQVLVQTIFDLGAVCDAGLAEALPSSLRTKLGSHLRHTDPTRCLVWSDISAAAEARRKLLDLLSDVD